MLTKSLDRYAVILLWTLTLNFYLTALKGLEWVLWLRVVLIIYLVIRAVVQLYFAPEKTKFLPYLLLVGIYAIHGLSTIVNAGFINGFLSIKRMFGVMVLYLPIYFFSNTKLLKINLTTFIITLCLSLLSIFFQMQGGDLYLIWGDLVSTRNGFIRYSSLIGNPNVTGLGWILVLPLLRALTKSKTLFLLGVIVCLFVIQATIAKSLLLSLPACLIMIFSFDSSLKHFFKAKKKQILVILAISFTLGGIYLTNNPVVLNRFDTMRQHTFGSEKNPELDVIPNVIVDFKMRLVENVDNVFVLLKSGPMWPYSMLWGGGIQNVGDWATHSRNGYFLPHNTFLEIFMQTGILGLSFFVIFCIQHLIYACRVIRNSDSRLKSMTLVSLILILCYCFFVSVTYHPIFGVILWSISSELNRMDSETIVLQSR